MVKFQCHAGVFRRQRGTVPPAFHVLEAVPAKYAHADMVQDPPVVRVCLSFFVEDVDADGQISSPAVLAEYGPAVFGP